MIDFEELQQRMRLLSQEVDALFKQRKAEDPSVTPTELLFTVAFQLCVVLQMRCDDLEAEIRELRVRLAPLPSAKGRSN